LAKYAINAFQTAGKTVGVSTFATDRETLERYHNMGINMISADDILEVPLLFG